jgi:hypothetical protein
MLIEKGSRTIVRPVELDADQQADVELSLGGEVDEAILVVIGTSRHTWQAAPYRLTLERR